MLPDAEDCWITSDGSNGTGRIARYQGGDAANVYQQERQRAQPTSQDQGNGLSVETLGYFAGDVTGIGDEAFCTDLSTGIQGGVLVRQGDTLVYVSLLGSSASSGDVCQQAQAVARQILPLAGRRRDRAPARYPIAGQCGGPALSPPCLRSYSSSSVPIVTSP